MQRLTERDIRRAMVNCSRGEAASMTLPRNLAELDWDNLDFLGWRDPKAPLRGYLVQRRDDGPVGVALTAPESTVSRAVAATCMLCRSGQSGDNVCLFTARRYGPAGRNGNTVGSYICADLACSRYVRVERASASLRPDPGRSVPERIAGLTGRLAAFIDEVLRT